MNLLTINKPEIVEVEKGVRLQAKFEIDGNEETLWYEVDKKYKPNLTVERTDAFVVALFLLALNKGYDIRVNGTMSKRLFYTFNMYLLPLTAQIRSLKQIKVHCEELESDPLPSGKGVATGLTCGIDTFSTIRSHMGDETPDAYKITHFTFFNVGSHGMLGGDKARKLFQKRMELVKPCAEELGKELISVDSNISELLLLNFYESHSYRHVSAAMILQKLFNVYYYSSAYSLKYFELKPTSPGHYDIFNMDMLSTENTEFYSTNPYETRIEKTRFVSSFKPATKYLNVCIREGENCGECEKCIRTFFTLEVLGKLEDFSSILNLRNYNKARKRYIAKVMAFYDKDDYMKEILDEMLKQDFKVPMYSKLAANYLKVRRLVRK